MNETETSLREVLDAYAGTVDEATEIGRVDGVRRRIATARRRRRAAVATVAAAVVVIAGAALALPHHHDAGPADAPSQMVGHAVPRTTSSLGSRFAYERGYVGHGGTLTVKLPARATGYLVRMASATDVGRLRLSLPGTTVWSTRAGGFGAFYSVGSSAAKVTVSHDGGHGDVALAVYTLAAPERGSYVRAGVIYPATVDDEPMLGAQVGAAGQRSVSIRATNAEGHVVFYPTCTGLPKHTQLEVTIRGRAGFVGMGSGRAGRSPIGFAAPDGSSYESAEPFGRFTAVVSAVDAHGKPTAIPASARLGLGMYPRGDQIDGLAKIIETNGHRWGLASVHRAAPGQRRQALVVGGVRPVLVVYGSTGTFGSTVVSSIGGTSQSSFSGGGSSQYVLASGHSARVDQRFSSPTPSGRLYVATYSLADEK